MRSRLLAFVLVFLLLGMQQEMQVHALAHAAQALQQANDEHFQLPADNAPCALCGLLASGSNAIPVGSPVVHSIAADSVAFHAATPSLSSSPLHYYRSRAPPSLL